jgi:PAS domain S-box-containing protein
MDKHLKILIAEDIPSDAELILREIKKSNIRFREHIVDTREEFVQAIQDFHPDIILSDYSMPYFDGMSALSLAKELVPHIPFILVTGSINEETAVEVMKAGADDYVIKEHIARLGTAIKKAIEKREMIYLRKQAEEKLAWEQYLNKTIIENIPDSIYIKDLESRFLRINRAMANRVKLNDPLKALGKSDFDFFEKDHAQEAFKDEQEIIRTENPIIGKEEIESWYNYLPNWVSTTKMPLRDAKGKIIGTFGISRDITERKRVEDELLKSKEKAEESDRLKTAFLHNISHEIRTPMNAIVGFSGFLNKPDLTSEKRKHFTDIIIESSSQLLSIITDLITIATIEAGQDEVHEEETDINKLCQLVYDQFISIAENQRVSLRYKVELKTGEFVLNTDHTKLTQILVNLVDNALKFTPEGEVIFGCRRNGEMLDFYTQDTGIGIPSEMHKEIFKRFHQVDSSATRRFGGSGLGLPICKAYVELLGGSIWLESEPGKGSTFYFNIPYKALSNKHTKIQVSGRQELRLKKPKILLIAEDEDSNFIILQEFLSDMELTIIRAENGLQAVEICRTTAVDLVLMDIKMPEMDGYEATKLIKEKWPKMPVIAQTAYSFDIDKEKAFQNGFDYFITKPISESELLKVIKTYLAD